MGSCDPSLEPAPQEPRTLTAAPSQGEPPKADNPAARSISEAVAFLDRLEGQLWLLESERERVMTLALRQLWSAEDAVERLLEPQLLAEAKYSREREFDLGLAD